jgi:hypothetical protein
MLCYSCGRSCCVALPAISGQPPCHHIQPLLSPRLALYQLARSRCSALPLLPSYHSNHYLAQSLWQNLISHAQSTWPQISRVNLFHVKQPKYLNVRVPNRFSISQDPIKPWLYCLNVQFKEDSQLNVARAVTPPHAVLESASRWTGNLTEYYVAPSKGCPLLRDHRLPTF